MRGQTWPYGRVGLVCWADPCKISNKELGVVSCQIHPRPIYHIFPHRVMWPRKNPSIYIYIYIYIYILLDFTAGWLSHLALAIYIYLLLLIMKLWHRQAIFEPTGEKRRRGVRFKLLPWSTIAQSVCEWAFSLLVIVYQSKNDFKSKWNHDSTAITRSCPEPCGPLERTAF